jgi:hypothetical protein
MDNSLDLELDLFKSFEIASETIEILLESVVQTIYLKEIAHKSIKFGIDFTLNLLFSTLEVNFIRYDIGSVPDCEESEEPQAPIQDTWVRSSVPVHKKFIPPPEIEPSPLIDAKSTVSFKTSFNGTGSMNKFKKTTNKIKEQLIPVPVPMNYIQPEASDGEEYMRLKKERDSKRKIEEIKRLEILKKEEEEKKRQLNKQLNGKNNNFTYDYQGKIILVNPFVSGKGLIEQTNFKVVDVNKEYVKETGNSVPGTVYSGSKMKILQPIKEKPSKVPQNYSILEYLKLAPGVSIIPGGHKYNNTPKPLDKTSKKLNWSEPIIKLDQVLKDKPKKIPSTRVLEPIIETRPGLAKIPAKNNEIIKLSIKDTDKNPEIKTADRVRQYSKDKNKDEYLTPVDIFNLGIISNTNWGINPSYTNPKLPIRMPKSSTAKDQWEILGHLTKKPKNAPFMSTQEIISLSTLTKKPRDRPFVEKITKKNKQPPPPFGQTMISSSMPSE